MQKLLVCIFAFSLCLTANARPDGAPLPAVSSTPLPAPTLVTPAAVPDLKKQEATTATAPVTPDNSTANNKVPGSPGASGDATVAPPTTGKPSDTTPVVTPSTKDPMVNPPTVKPTPVTTPATAPTAAPPKPTTPPPAPTSTKAPAPTTEHAKNASTPPTVIVARGFDGASFIGGIVLALGLIAVGFMGFKYYKTQTERNYHTL